MLVAVSEPNALGAFLRARRDGLSPADVGLPDSGRRRTPGLRREEVAALAGISIDYLVRLEQGRDTNPSPSVLLAIGEALRLTVEERRHLFKVSHVSSSPEVCESLGAPGRELVPGVQLVLDRLGPTPAVVVDPIGDVVAWNATWELLVGPIGLLDDPVPNLARFTFLHPRARDAHPDWDAAADDQVRRLRAVAPLWAGHEPFDRLVAELGASSGFAERWAAHRVAAPRSGAQRLVHPVVGELRIEPQVLQVPEPADLQVVVWLPADEATDDAVRRATVGGTALRAV